MVGNAAGDREARLDHVQPAHLTARHLAALGEVPGVTHGRRVGAQGVGIQAHDHLGFVQGEMRAIGLCEGQPGPLALVVARKRLVLAPPGLCVGLQQPIAQGGPRRRAGGLGQHGQPGPLRLGPLGTLLAHQLSEACPVLLDLLRARTLHHSLAPVRIVEFEDRGLGEGVGSPEALRVLGIAFDLDRTSVERRDHQPGRHAGQLAGRGKALGLAGQAVGRLGGEGQKLVSLPATACRPRQRQRRPHQLQPSPTGER